MKYKLSAGILACFLFFSCTIKENRCNCPCYLILNFDRVDTTTIFSAKVDFHSDIYGPADSFHYTADLGLADFRKPKVVEVPRSNIQVNVFSGDDGMYVPYKGVIIPKGEDCPPLYMHNILVNTEFDTVTDTVRLHKSYCTLSVGMIADGKSKSFEVGVKGNVCGYLDDGSPMEGDFLVVSKMPGGESKQFRLPRQMDTSLSLEIYSGGETIRDFALGDYIARSGYDWGAPDLGDVDVTVDFALAEVVVKIGEWETKYVYGVEI